MTGLIFDLDGTLLNTLEDLTDATNYALGCFGCPSRSLGEIRRIVGNGAKNQILKSLPGTPDDPDPEAVLSVYKSYYNTHCQVKTAPYPDIVDALEFLRQQYPIAIASNKPDSAVKALCEFWFPGIPALGERDGCPRKPAPDMVWEAMRMLQVDRCIYIGDSEVDITTAANAGVPCLSVLWGFRDQDALLSAGAEFFCDVPQNLIHRISEMEAHNGQ